MVTIVKHEWHQVDSQFAYELTKEDLEAIYPDMDEAELEELWQQVEAGEADIDQIISDAYDEGVDIEWDRQYDDWWTERKGGYEVTYEYGDDDSWTTPDTPPEPTHKCTKCRWEGSRWESRTVYINEQGEALPDDTEEWHDTKDGCPMCDSDIELTEHGKEEEEARAKRMAEIDAMFPDEELDHEVTDLETALQELKDEFARMDKTDETDEDGRPRN